MWTLCLLACFILFRSVLLDKEPICQHVVVPLHVHTCISEMRVFANLCGPFLVVTTNPVVLKTGNNTTYKKLNYDPAPSWKKIEWSPPSTKKEGFYHSQSLQQIALLLKCKKTGISLRPTVFFLSFPSYQLSKHVSRIITPLIGKSDYHVLDSTVFASFIVSQSLSTNDVVVSFDVVSLFTTVLVSLASNVSHC